MRNAETFGKILFSKSLFLHFKGSYYLFKYSISSAKKLYSLGFYRDIWGGGG